MKSTPARLAETRGALVVPDPARGEELLLTEVGYRALTTSLEHERQAAVIGAASFALSAAIFTAGAVFSAGAGGVAAVAAAPLALLAGAAWGRASFGRKMRRLGAGQIPRHAVLGGGRKEALPAALGALALTAAPVAGALKAPLFMLYLLAFVASYGRRSAGLLETVRGVFSDAEASEEPRELEPGSVRFLGQSAGEDDGRCPVCGDPLGSLPTRVHCEVCRTAHHPDCWAFAGRCSVFACPGEVVATDHLDFHA